AAALRLVRRSAGKARHSPISRLMSTEEKIWAGGTISAMVRPSRGAPAGSMYSRDASMTTPEMTMSKLTRALLALLVAGAATLASAQEAPPPTQHGGQRASEPRQGEQRQADARESVLRLLPADSVTEHAVAIPGGTLTYSATAGTLSLFDQSGERSAAVYYTAYVAKNAEPANRP